jgi:hypothetical protein
MDYNSIKRISNEELAKITDYHSKFNIKERITKIIEFYLPQLNELIKVKNLTPVTIDNLTLDSESSLNRRPHILSIKVTLHGAFSFNLEEQFYQCGILVSTNNSVYWSNIGIGTFIHAIKEDIARITGYSYLMYTDTIFETTKKHNHKIMDKIGAKEVFRGLNTRSSNMICVWIKDLNEYYNTRTINKQKTSEVEVKLKEIPF